MKSTTRAYLMGVTDTLGLAAVHSQPLQRRV